MLEDGLGCGGTEDDVDDAAGAAAAGAGEDVGAERPPEKLGPGDGPPGRARANGPGSVVPRFGSPLRLTPHFQVLVPEAVFEEGLLLFSVSRRG